jgi:hypothetical protein
MPERFTLDARFTSNVQGEPRLMKERKAFLLRLDPAIYESLERWAQQELRSVNGQIEFLLRQAVSQRERGTKTPKGAESGSPDAEQLPADEP